MVEIYEELGKKLDEAAKIILGSKYLVAMVGAGLSVESGIPPYRGREDCGPSSGSRRCCPTASSSETLDHGGRSGIKGKRNQATPYMK